MCFPSYITSHSQAGSMTTTVLGHAAWSYVQLRKDLCLILWLYLLLDRHCGNRCKNQLLISSVVLYFAPQVTQKQITVFQWCVSPKYLPAIYLNLWALLLWEIHSWILSQWCGSVILQHYTCLCVATEIHQALQTAIIISLWKQSENLQSQHYNNGKA